MADLALARSEKSSQRIYSMSAQIRRERDDYYSIFERTQKGDLDITDSNSSWIAWIAHLTALTSQLPVFFERLTSGANMGVSGSMNVNGSSSIDCSTVLRASSLHPNGLS